MLHLCTGLTSRSGLACGLDFCACIFLYLIHIIEAIHLRMPLFRLSYRSFSALSYSWCSSAEYIYVKLLFPALSILSLLTCNRFESERQEIYLDCTVRFPSTLAASIMIHETIFISLLWCLFFCAGPYYGLSARYGINFAQMS